MLLLIGESKLDDSYPTSQLLIDGFSEPFRLDRNSNGGGLLIYVREDIPTKLLFSHSLPDDIEGMFIELNFRKSKWLLGGMYHPPSKKDDYFFKCIRRALDVYNDIYDKFLLVGDFNAEENGPVISDFLDLYNLTNLARDNTCFKSLKNPLCIDIFLTNCHKSFQNTNAISAGMSDRHKMIVTVMKTTFVKAKPRVITYRSYKHFDRVSFRKDLKNELYSHADNINKYQQFESVFLNVLGRHAPLKKKTVRANE